MDPEAADSIAAGAIMTTVRNLIFLLVALPLFADPIGTLVDIGHGRKMHLVCFGSGSPTVVMESGAAEGFYTWWLVQQQLRGEMRTCSYDRAGFGWSDPPPSRSIANYVDDLHALLMAAGEKPPFILAGHSMGASIVQRYYWRFPSEVAGIILVDPANDEGGFPHFPAMQQAVAENRARRTKEMDEWRAKNSWPAQSFPSELPKDLHDKLVAASASRNWWEARFGEGALPDLEPVMTPEQRHIAVPLVVITAGKPAKPPNWSDETQAAFQARWIAMQDEIASRSPKSKRVLAPASHRVQLEAPSFVSDQIRALARSLAAH
jgi:pimeloyl-ACP methyl ester carboxylesterase